MKMTGQPLRFATRVKYLRTIVNDLVYGPSFPRPPRGASVLKPLE